MFPNRFKVKFRTEGRGGWATYEENNSQLNFPSELKTVGFIIDVPPSNEWNDFCDLNNATWAKDRRNEILNKIGQKAARSYWGGTYSVGELEIDVKYPSILKLVEGLFGR